MASGDRKARSQARRRSFFAAARNNFLAGLIIVAPVVITIYLTWTIITFVDDQVVPLIPAVYNPRTYINQDIPGFGLLIFLIFTTVVGYFAKNLFGRQLIRLGESWLESVPVIRSIYNALKQIVETILSHSKSSFQNACLAEYPSKGIWAIAFVSPDTKGEILTSANEEILPRIIPTSASNR